MAAATGTGTHDISVADEIAEAIADSLTSHGFDIRKLASDESCYLQLTNAEATLVNLNITANELIWDYRSVGNSPRDPDQATAIVLAILDADSAAASPAPPARTTPATLKDQIGRAAASHGMRIRLVVLDPDRPYAEVAIDNPADPNRGTICVSDDGAIYWHCRVDHRRRPLRLAAATGDRPAAPAQPRRPDGLHAPQIADAIARALATLPKTN